MQGSMSGLKFSYLLIILLVFAVSAFVSPALAADRESAAFAIQDADVEMVSAYEAVIEAESAGADVSGFSKLLKDAAQLLAQAHTSFRAGDFESATRFAGLSAEIGNEVEAKAYQLRDLQRGLPVWHTWLTIVQSLFAVLAVVLLSFLAWSVFKRLYYRRADIMRPEVVSDES